MLLSVQMVEKYQDTLSDNIAEILKLAYAEGKIEFFNAITKDPDREESIEIRIERYAISKFFHTIALQHSLKYDNYVYERYYQNNQIDVRDYSQLSFTDLKAMLNEVEKRRKAQLEANSGYGNRKDPFHSENYILEKLTYIIEELQAEITIRLKYQYPNQSDLFN